MTKLGKNCIDMWGTMKYILHSRRKKLFVLALFFVSPCYSAVDPEVQAQFTILNAAVANLHNNQPGFISRTASGMLSTIVTGIVVFVGSRWLIDSYLTAKNPKKPAPEHFAPQAQQPFTFKNLAGKIPADVLEVTEFIKDSKKFIAMGAKMPRGVLLVGPPGTGKTSIARAIAGESQAYFVAIAASEFIEMFVGNGPRRVRELFAGARAAVASGAYKKAIIFIDELDSIGGARNAVFDSGGAEYRNTLNELLHQMDGFHQDDSIFILGATNREQDIDPALKRPGRFDRIVEIPLPDIESREAILKLYAQSIKYSKDIDFSSLARQSKGMSGAELKNIVNEAAIYAVRAQSQETRQEHFENALRSKSLKAFNF